MSSCVLPCALEAASETNDRAVILVLFWLDSVEQISLLEDRNLLKELIDNLGINRVEESGDCRSILLDQLVSGTLPVNGYDCVCADHLGEVMQASCAAADEVAVIAALLDHLIDLLCYCKT